MTINNKDEREIVMSNIKGKVVAITGASSGIGESTARLLAAKGAHVICEAVFAATISFLSPAFEFLLVAVRRSIVII